MPGTRPGEHPVLGFAVPDLGAVLRALSERGIVWERFSSLPQNGAGVPTVSDATRIAWFRDPDGNLVSVVQYGPGGIATRVSVLKRIDSLRLYVHSVPGERDVTVIVTGDRARDRGAVVVHRRRQMTQE